MDFNGESDHVHLLIEYKPNIALSKLIANLKTVSSRLIRRDYPDLQSKYFYNKPYFWTGAYFVASCGGVTVEQLKKYVENQKTPEKYWTYLDKRTQTVRVAEVKSQTLLPFGFCLVWLWLDKFSGLSFLDHSLTCDSQLEIP